MIRRPPRSTLFPYPPLSRPLHHPPLARLQQGSGIERKDLVGRHRLPRAGAAEAFLRRRPQRRGGRLSDDRSEEHTSELQSRLHLVCRLLLEKKKKHIATIHR